MTDHCCGLAVIFCGFISHLIGRETINTPEISSSVHGFTGKMVTYNLRTNSELLHLYVDIYLFIFTKMGYLMLLQICHDVAMLLV